MEMSRVVMVMVVDVTRKGGWNGERRFLRRNYQSDENRELFVRIISVRAGSDGAHSSWRAGTTAG